MTFNFINWRELSPLIAGQKNRKVPWSVAANSTIDHLNPVNFITEQSARDNANQQANIHIGVVLSESDNYFLVDLDACRDPCTGTPTAEAVEILNYFNGAAVEVSHNLTGFHIMGYCDRVALGERRNKFKRGGFEIEFYTTGRFVALGHGFTGTLNLDWTAALAALIPTREAVETIEFTDQADPRYTGPESDNDLITLMRAARGSANQMFGTSASFADLWDRNTTALAIVFPSVTGGEFDASGADAALMSHLAFYTGRNTARMDRLFRQSGLMRDKYADRPYYANKTVSFAVAGDGKVYDKLKPEILHAVTTDASRRDEFPEILSIPEQLEYFAGCTYVTLDHSIATPDGTMLKPAQFKSTYGGHCFLMSSNGEKPTYNAFEALTENRVARFPKVSRTDFRPTAPPGEIKNDRVNVYYPENIRRVVGDPSPMLGLMQKMLPVDHDRDIMWAYCASLVQNPGKKFLWAPVLQGIQGNGKSLIAEMITRSIGDKYTFTVDAKKIGSQFNSYLKNKIFINVDELSTFQKYEMYDSIKSLITGKRQSIEPKGTDQYMITDFCANWFFCMNPKDAMVQKQGERRFAVFFGAQQSRQDMFRDGMLVDNYFPKLWNWLEADGFAIMYDYLMSYKIPAALDPARDLTIAPETSSTAEAVEASYTNIEQYIIDAVDAELPGFRGGWVSTWGVSKLILDERLAKQSPRKMATVLDNLGYEKRGRVGKPLMNEDMTRPVLWCKPNIVLDYGVAQGYSNVVLNAVNAEPLILNPMGK